MSGLIKISMLRDLQQEFQKEMSELIDLYLRDAKKKIANLYRALEEENLNNFQGAARELRHRSLEVGAVEFSYYCLSLETAVQELRLESLHQLTTAVEKCFHRIRRELDEIKKTPPWKRQELLKVK